MKTFYKYAVIAVISLVSLSACSSDDTQKQTGPATIEQPQVSVRDVTTTGFTLRWDAVEGAGTYNYTFNDGEEVSTDKCEISFSELQRQTEYVVAVKACPQDAARFSASAYTYIHVKTDEIEQLPKPKVTLGCAYASRTIISWSDVPEAASFEYTIDGKTSTTEKRQVSINTLAKSQEYTFSVRALTSDARRFTDSSAEQLAFTTSADDIPEILIVPVDIISDAVAFDIYATSEMTYFYDVITAATYAKYTDEQIVKTYQDYAIEYAREQGISIQLAMASLLKSGTNSIALTGLTSELSYVILAFGMDLKGEITSNLVTVPFKTTADGYSAGPNYGGASWFKQSFYISNAYAAMGYNWTNSVMTLWQGTDVTKVRYRTLSTNTFNQIFPNPNDKQAITAFLKDDNYAYQLEDALLSTVNSSNGYNSITSASMGVSYTLLTLATSSSGEEVLCLNSVTTKTSTTAANWFLARMIQSENYGPLYNTFAGAMQGVDVVSCRYLVAESSTLEGVSTSRYAELVAENGYDVESQYISSINNNGFAVIFGERNGIKPATGYTFISTAVNSVGDRNTKWATVTTAAAPAGTGSYGRTSTSKTGVYGPGIVIPDLDRFIYPLETILLPANARPEGDLWTIIHNKQILN